MQSNYFQLTVSGGDGAPLDGVLGPVVGALSVIPGDVILLLQQMGGNLARVDVLLVRNPATARNES